MKKTLSNLVINSPKKLFCPLLVMGQLSLAVQAVAFEDIVYSPDVTKIRNVQLDTTQTQRVVTETDYINWYGAGDNGYSRLRENKDALTQQLIDKFSGYSLEEKKEILRQLRSSGGIHFHAILQDRQGVHNYYEYSLNIDPDAITPDTLEHYLKTSVDQFHNTFRNYVENKEGEGWALIDYLKLTAIAPSVNQRHPLSSDFADALGIEGLDPESQGGQQKQLALLNQMLDEAGEHGGDITRSPTFVNAAYQLAEKSPGFTEMTEANQQTAAAEAGKAISYWIKQHRINGITRAQNKLKDNPITPDVLFLQELADTMGVSPRSLPALASKKNWEGKSAFEHLSSEGALYQFLNALVPDREHYDGGGNVGSPIGYRDNSNRKGHSKQQIIDIFYTGLDVVDEAKKSAFLHGLDLVFDKSYGSIGAPAVADQTSGLNYDSLPEFMRDLPSYFVKTREQLATDARKKFQFLEAKKQSIANDTEAQFNARYDAFKQANPDVAPGSVPDLDQFGLTHSQRSEIEGKGQQFFDQLIAASDKDDFKALSTNTERTLTAIATLFETFVPGVGSLVAAPLHASAGNWTEFGTNLAIGLADVASLGASKMATTVGKQATKLALTSGKSAAEAAKAGQEAATAFLRSSRIRAVDISAIAIGSAAEAYDFGQGIDALLNANTPVERRQAIIGLIATSVMAAPTPVIYTAQKLNKIRSTSTINPGTNRVNTPIDRQSFERDIRKITTGRVIEASDNSKYVKVRFSGNDEIRYPGVRHAVRVEHGDTIFYVPIKEPAGNVTTVEIDLLNNPGYRLYPLDTEGNRYGITRDGLNGGGSTSRHSAVEKVPEVNLRNTLNFQSKHESLLDSAAEQVINNSHLLKKIMHDPSFKIEIMDSVSYQGSIDKGSNGETKVTGRHGARVVLNENQILRKYDTLSEEKKGESYGHLMRVINHELIDHVSSLYLSKEQGSSKIPPSGEASDHLLHLFQYKDKHSPIYQEILDSRISLAQELITKGHYNELKGFIDSWLLELKREMGPRTLFNKKKPNQAEAAWERAIEWSSNNGPTETQEAVFSKEVIQDINWRNNQILSTFGDNINTEEAYIETVNVIKSKLKIIFDQFVGMGNSEKLSAIAETSLKPLQKKIIKNQ